MAEARARVAKHPIHPMLVVVPLGLWFAALVFDITETFTGNALWRTIAFWNIVVGIIGALAAAVPGFLDYLAMQGRARRIGTWHHDPESRRGGSLFGQRVCSDAR